MYNFEKLLYPNEKILYQGRSFPGKGKKNIIGLLIGEALMIFTEVILIYQLTQFLDPKSLLLAFVFFIMILIFGYGILYELFIKKIVIADDEYCLTNQRAFKYESKTGNLVYGYLNNYRSIRAINVKDNFGDVRMEMIYKNGNDTNFTKEDIVEIKNLMLHPNEENMPYMLFESVENPEEIVKLVIEARKELQKK